MSYDLSKLYINVFEPTNGVPLYEAHSDLSAFPEFQKCDDIRIKIAVLCGDTDSPFVKIKDRETMIRAIFDFLEVKNDQLMQDIIAYRDNATNIAWMKYVQILHETDFTDWLLCRRDYDYFLQKSHDPQTADEDDDKYLSRKNKIRETIMALGKQVKAIEAKLFPESKAARQAAIIESKSRITLFAEKYAESNTYV